MKKDAAHKTNAMRLLEAAGVAYGVCTYPVDESDLSGVHAAAVSDVPAEAMFKTLVLVGERTGHFVCCIPVAEEVDLKKAARAAGDKAARMLPLRDLTPLTGYVRGGCSPLGMRKQLPTFIDETAVLFDEIYVSAGERGVSVRVEPEALAGVVGAEFVDLTL